MDHKFKENLHQIKSSLKENEIPIVRILYTEDDGKISSLSIPSTKLLSSTIDQLMSILTIKGKLLYPDINTAFNDPCSVQENLCMIGNFLGDRRDILENRKISINTTITFTLVNNTTYDIDLFHDLRNEITIEAIKAGVDMNIHYTTDNKIQSFGFDANSLLAVADSVQKMQFLINCIVGSYGQGLSTSDENNKVIFISPNNNTIIKSIKMNPYSYLKDWKC